MTFKSFYTSGLSAASWRRRVEGVELLTEDGVCVSCFIINGLWTVVGRWLWVCELDSPSQSQCLCFIGHEASSAKLAGARLTVLLTSPTLGGTIIKGFHHELKGASKTELKEHSKSERLKLKKYPGLPGYFYFSLFHKKDMIVFYLKLITCVCVTEGTLKF